MFRPSKVIIRLKSCPNILTLCGIKLSMNSKYTRVAITPFRCGSYIFSEHLCRFNPKYYYYYYYYFISNRVTQIPIRAVR